MAARLYDLYKDKVRAELTTKFGYENANQVPTITKIVVNMGVGKDAIADRKAMDAAANDLGLITGQKALVTKAKKAIATYKLQSYFAQRPHVGIFRPFGEHRASTRA